MALMIAKNIVIFFWTYSLLLCFAFLCVRSQKQGVLFVFMLSYIWPSTMTLTTTQYWNNSNLHMQMLPLLFLSVPIEVQMINQQMINHSGHGTGQLWRKNTKYRLFVICCQCLHFCFRGFSKLWPLFGFVAKSQNLFVVIKIWCLGCCKNKESLKLAQNLQVALSCLKWVLQEREREYARGLNRSGRGE